MGRFKEKTPRAICFDILNCVEGAGFHLDRLLANSFKRYRHLSSLDRSFLTELTYGVIRWRGKLDWVIGHLSKIPLEKIESEILNILRLGLYQILFLSRTPVSAAVNESVELAKKIRRRGEAGFVNAVLRSSVRQRDEIPYPEIAEDPELHISVTQSHPLWLVQRWVKELGVEETLRICTFNNQIPPLTLRVNTLKINRKALMGKLREKGLNPKPTAYSEEGVVLQEPPPTSALPFLKEGFYVVQDEASQLVSSLLEPQPGERILDACAAPGGKTGHMAQKMENRGEIYALDLNRKKLHFIDELCQRLEIKIVKTLEADAALPLPVSKDLTFDRVLADVPCSGFGTLRRNPDLKWRKGEGDIKRLSELQLSILHNISAYLKKKGILVYSTCTVFHEENEDVIEKFLATHLEFQLDRIEKVASDGSAYRPAGAAHREGKISFFDHDGYFKTFPPQDGMDGFFVARLRRN